MPPAVVTTTSTAPAACAGVVTVIDVAEFTVTPVAGVPPKVTDVAPVRFVPVIVTVVPPAVGPALGESPVTVGAGTGAAVVLVVLVDVVVVVTGRGRFGSGAITTFCSPPLMRTNSSTVMTGIHSPFWHTSA